jgi:hypothetical protein
MRNNSPYLPIDQCEVGAIYKVRSRNLKIGVYTDSISPGFIGIRLKFDSEFLDKETHWDNGGTACPTEKIGKLPDDIPLQTSLGSIDNITKRDVAFDKPIADGGKGWYFLDTGEPSKDIRPCSKNNEKLFDYMKQLENNIIL